MSDLDNRNYIPYYMKFWRHFNVANLAIFQNVPKLSVAKFKSSLNKALFIWSRVPETTLPLETTLRSVYMEL